MSLVHDIHPSWLSGSSYADLIKLLITEDDSSIYLNRYLHDEFQLNPAFLKTSVSTLTPLLGLNEDELKDLLLLGGMVMNQEVLKSFIRKETKQHIIDTTNEDYYRFTLTRGPFLTKKLLTDLCPPDLNWSDLESFEMNLIRSGLRCLGLGLAAEDEELGRRMTLKLPAEYSHVLAQDHGFQEINTPENQERCQALLKKIGKEVKKCQLFSA